MKRASGILLPVFSLPSPHGIGTFGKSAYKFIDFLYKAGQSYWQILPLGATAFGDSPYQSYSTYAGNPYFVDIDMLKADGLLTDGDIELFDFGRDENKTDYEKLKASRYKLLYIAYKNSKDKYTEKIKDFVNENKEWIYDYALFTALKKHFSDKPWYEWDDRDIRFHKPEATEKYMILLKDEVDFYIFIQYEFYAQWGKLREYARKKHIKIIGDLPIYVAMDSADVWADKDSFCLDEENVPVQVAGVPPDYFSEDGQLWGNPLYNWDYMKKNGYGWWIRRIGGASKLYDVLRIDHFRGLASYWAVPYGSETAKTGKWIKGPGIEFVSTITNWFNEMSFIAEDLGILSDDVYELLEKSGLPGMKILEFAFAPGEPSLYLPHNYDRNCVCYTGTHDNDTVASWLENGDKAEIENAVGYLGLNEKEGYVNGVIRGGMSSVADLFVAQLQDWLALGNEARINVPGVVGGNWQWRVSDKDITDELAERIYKMTVRYSRDNKEIKADFKNKDVEKVEE